MSRRNNDEFMYNIDLLRKICNQKQPENMITPCSDVLVIPEREKMCITCIMRCIQNQIVSFTKIPMPLDSFHSFLVS